MPSKTSPGGALPLSKGSKPVKPQGNPYKVLYWMGAGVVLMLIGVVALALWFKPQPRERPDPERTLIWFYEDGNKGGPATVAVLEESMSQTSLVAVPFIAPEQAIKAYADRGARAATDQVSTMLQRKLHHRLFMPYSLVATLIDAASGVSIDGKQLNGAGALAYIKEGGEQAPSRTIVVMLALTEAASINGVSMGVSEGLSLARQIETSMDLMSIPQVLERWNQYSTIKVESPPSNDPYALRKLLQADPPDPAGK